MPPVNVNTMRGNPPGLGLIRNFRGRNWSVNTYRYVVWIVTFVAYTSYHASRKPSSIVKSVLDPDPLHNKKSTLYPWPTGDVFTKREMMGYDENVQHEGKGWAPFDGNDGTSRLGEIDVAFLVFYSGGMYVAGHLGDKLDLRLFLTTGMMASGIFVGLFGMGYFWNIHVFSYYLVMQMIAGLLQATGWPSVVAVIGNWFGESRRGLIMGVWNAHTSVGNISGSLLAASVLDYGWGWSFILPGAFIFAAGLIVFLFLPAYPEDVGFPMRNGSDHENNTSTDEESMVQNTATGTREENSIPQTGSGSRKSVHLTEACLIPGVIPFALCLFFSKLVAYTFLYWLPFYLSQTAIGGEYMSVKSAGNLSTLFDVGGIVGGILAGYISDKLKARATTAVTFMYTAIPAMILYCKYGNVSQTMNILLMVTVGLFVNGPYALITTAVSADLGTHNSVRGNSRALATVTAIIDGTGSLGAALGPFLTGFLSTHGWDFVFGMLCLGALIAGVLLSGLVIAEIRDRGNNPAVSEQPGGDESQPLLREQR